MKLKIPVTIYEDILIYDASGRMSELVAAGREVDVKWIAGSPYLVYTI